MLPGAPLPPAAVAVVELPQLADRVEQQLPLDAAADVLVRLEPAHVALERQAGLALEWALTGAQ